MKTRPYKILVLSDQKNKAEIVLKSAISLVKKIGGSVHFFYVKSAADVVAYENQLSAMRTLNKDQITTDNRLKQLVESFGKKYNISLSYSFAFGNIRNEITQVLKTFTPDIVVLGKKPSSPFNLMGDSIADLVLEKHQGAVCITTENNRLDPDKNISLGFLNTNTTPLDLDLTNDLMAQNTAPFRSFNVVPKNGAITKESVQTDSNVIEYLFEDSQNSLDSIATYLEKNKVNLLCVSRANQGNQSKVSTHTSIKNVINKTNVSLLVTA